MAHTATRLPDGRVLIAGGMDGSADLASTEIYNPDRGTYSPIGEMRSHSSATLRRCSLTGGSYWLEAWTARRPGLDRIV
jgi:hypothetical protein